jgi:hypothetical protein
LEEVHPKRQSASLQEAFCLRLGFVALEPVISADLPNFGQRIDTLRTDNGLVKSKVHIHSEFF